MRNRSCVWSWRSKGRAVARYRSGGGEVASVARHQSCWVRCCWIRSLLGRFSGSVRPSWTIAKPQMLTRSSPTTMLVWRNMNGKGIRLLWWCHWGRGARECKAHGGKQLESPPLVAMTPPPSPPFASLRETRQRKEGKTEEEEERGGGGVRNCIGDYFGPFLEF